MHVAGAIAIGLVGLFFLLVVASLSPFLAIPIAVFLALVPVMWMVAAGRLLGERRSLNSEVPSSQEASYQPTVDPAERR